MKGPSPAQLEAFLDSGNSPGKIIQNASLPAVDNPELYRYILFQPEQKVSTFGDVAVAEHQPRHLAAVEVYSFNTGTVILFAIGRNPEVFA